MIVVPAPAPGAAACVNPGLQIKSDAGGGQYLADCQGKSLYEFEADAKSGNGGSVCGGACAQVWPPFLLKPGESVSAGPGVQGSMIGTITRNDGSQQITYNNHPLYYYSLDQKPGDTNGQGISSFDALWYLLKPDGSPQEYSAGNPGSGGGGSSGSGGSGGYSPY